MPKYAADLDVVSVSATGSNCLKRGLAVRPKGGVRVSVSATGSNCLKHVRIDSVEYAKFCFSIRNRIELFEALAINLRLPVAN